MTKEERERKEKYETKNWPEYKSIMEDNGFELIFSPDPDNGTNTPYQNLVIGDGIWLKDNELSFRDLKICGKKYDCPVSENSFNKFPMNGIYDFYDPYFEKAVYSLTHGEVMFLFKENAYKKYKNLYRFDYKMVSKIGIKYKRK